MKSTCVKCIGKTLLNKKFFLILEFANESSISFYRNFSFTKFINSNGPIVCPFIYELAENYFILSNLTQR